MDGCCMSSGRRARAHFEVGLCLGRSCAPSCGNCAVEDMTEDHKPNNEDEMRRVEASGGEVRRLDGEVPHRVFLRGKMYPGLAMTRAIGDTIGTSAGVSSTPTVRSFEASAMTC
ncbi:unnamed protein product [Prorocentrum cordatum]|uniref:PPM-type phosphatase domain-containing protein n=1 Tax=Prorocentrum cordatum TaxID=2364126 RepID=A0ABN9UDI5_9DINO|nr:unnamed protein product [Polarella glacialis]